VNNPSTAYEFDFTSLDGQPLPLKQFAGRPLVIVNTASRCGFTPQYAGLEALWTAHRDRGLVIIGAPSNDFGAQEPGNHDAIAAFCRTSYGVDFPLTAKVRVRGRAAHPLFRWLADQGGFLARPRWNFYKYLIGRDGQLKDWFGSVTAPTSARFARAVDRLMAGHNS
jgi:glutathione peroxidase